MLGPAESIIAGCVWMVMMPPFFLLFSFVIDIRMEKKCRGMESFAFWERYDNGSVRFRHILLIGHSSILRNKTRRKKTYLIGENPLLR